VDQNIRHINGLLELEAITDLMIQTATRIKKEAREERLKLEGVSTPSVRKGLDEKQIAEILGRRFKTINKKSGIPGRITA
jgi:hypothetical protein